MRLSSTLPSTPVVLCTLLPFLPFLKAQGPSDNSSSTTFLTDLCTYLNSTGYTTLCTALSNANQSDWASGLSEGTWTLFAPTNDAFAQVPQNVSGNATLLAERLSYHIVYGSQQNASTGGGAGGGGSSGSSSTPSAPSSETSTASASSSNGGSVTTQGTNVNAKRFEEKRSGFWGFFGHHFQAENSGAASISSGVYPNVTLGRTLLNASDLVQLEGGKHQVVAWTRSGPDGNVTILNQSPNITVNNATQWRNFLIAEVSGVLTPPGNLSTALQATNETLLARFASQIQAPSANGTNASVIELLQEARGFTFFAPTNEAFSSGAAAEAMQGNQTAITDAIFNHFVNGSTIYSPTLKEIASNSSAHSMVTSAGGQFFTFSQNSTGLFVSNGNGTEAQVVRPDVLVENGVVHIVDRVLFNSGSNPEVAGSAFSSASAAATQTSTDTFVIGGFPASAIQSQSASSSAGGGGGQSSSTSSPAPSSTASAFRFRRGV